MSSSIVFFTASSTAVASEGRCNEYLNIMAAERIAAIGFTVPVPEMSGAEPVESSQFITFVRVNKLRTVDWFVKSFRFGPSVRNPA